MFVIIILTLNLFAKYSGFLQKDNNLRNPVRLPEGGEADIEEAKKIRKKISNFRDLHD